MKAHHQAKCTLLSQPISTKQQPGECAMLEWSVEGGFGVDLNEQPVERSRQMQVCPEETTAYWPGRSTWTPARR